ncbi:hypothetical protein NLJ89_g5442 [Agrocybe chaxingu]|uniref:Uncharacterized protein n=1 Tax=Agrocybe chaxingu TaxID=84603 RepID=A0A9W8MX92_9AGAR|nr:hypothetical protein NLJ89_g5442 [Agrocybe chaxingu]
MPAVLAARDLEFSGLPNLDQNTNTTGGHNVTHIAVYRDVSSFGARADDILARTSAQESGPGGLSDGSKRTIIICVAVVVGLSFIVMVSVAFSRWAQRYRKRGPYEEARYQAWKENLFWLI